MSDPTRAPSETPQNDHALALENCAREPIHIPGRIQSFGALIGLDRKDFVVTHVSENWDEVWEGNPSADGPKLLGRRFEDVFSDRDLRHDLRGALGLPTIDDQRERLGLVEVGGRRLDVSVHVSDGKTMVIEAEPDLDPGGRPDRSVGQVRSMLAAIDSSDGEALLRTAVMLLRRTSGFDRVMAYQFLPTGDGEVVAEAKGPGGQPYLGLRYPASDVPDQVRAAMVRMPFRCIADVTGDSIPLHAVPGAGPLDLTLTHLRGVSPIHVEYLQNMGVTATVNLPVIDDGTLWAFSRFTTTDPACSRPGFGRSWSSSDTSFRCSFASRSSGDVLAMRRRGAALHHAVRHRGQTDDPNQSSGLEDIVRTLGPEMRRIIDADGVALCCDGAVLVDGSVPADELIEQIRLQSPREIYSTDRLSDLSIPPDPQTTRHVAGVLVMPLAADGDIALLFFRDEVTQQIRWAGASDKRIEDGPQGPRLHPRTSFAEYVETVTGRSRPWTHAHLAAAAELRTEWMMTLLTQRNLSQQQFKRHKEYQDLLIAELNHRVKNIFALVRSIARQTAPAAVDINGYVAALESRMASLATAHDLIGGTGTRWASIHQMLLTETSPHQNDRGRIVLEGPPMSLKPDVAPVMALVIHELLTNAAKHGALAGGDGRLSVRWAHRGGGMQLNWRESSPRRTIEPTRTGFGLSLIRRAIPHQCGGRATVRFDARGFSARFWLPGEAVQPDQPDQPDQVEPPPPPPADIDSGTAGLVVGRLR